MKLQKVGAVRFESEFWDEDGDIFGFAAKYLLLRLTDICRCGCQNLFCTFRVFVFLTKQT